LARRRIGHAKAIESRLEDVMATRKASARKNRIAAVDELPQEPAEVLREELRLILEEVADQGRRVAFTAAILGGAGLLGLGAFGALTTAAIAALGRQDTTRGALLMAAADGAGAGVLAEVGVKRLGRVAPEAVENIQQDVKEAAKAVRRAT
jgi:Putative Actinobacterial Holin-X, holin superfamily III